MGFGSSMDSFLQSNFENMRKMMGDMQEMVMKDFKAFDQGFDDAFGTHPLAQKESVTKDDLQSHFARFTEQSCTCVNSECHCVTEKGDNLNDLQDKLHAHIQSACNCTETKCECVDQNGDDYTNEVGQMMALALRDDIKQQVNLQDSMFAQMQDFLNNGLGGLMDAMFGGLGKQAAAANTKQKLQVFHAVSQGEKKGEEADAGEEPEAGEEADAGKEKEAVMSESGEVGAGFGMGKSDHDWLK